MIEITDGFTRITVAADEITGPQTAGGAHGHRDARAASGARVSVEFQRDTALAPGELVRVIYDFEGAGRLREATGVAQPIRTSVQWGRPVVYHYRLSHWITPAAQRATESIGHQARGITLPREGSTTAALAPPDAGPADAAPAGDQIRA